MSSWLDAIVPMLPTLVPSIIALLGLWWVNRSTGLHALEKLVETSKTIHKLEGPDSDSLKIHYYGIAARIAGRPRIWRQAILGCILVGFGLILISEPLGELPKNGAFLTAITSILMGAMALNLAWRGAQDALAITIELAQLEQTHRKAIAKRRKARLPDPETTWNGRLQRRTRNWAAQHPYGDKAIIGAAAAIIMLLFWDLYYCWGGACPAGTWQWLQAVSRFLHSTAGDW